MGLFVLFVFVASINQFDKTYATYVIDDNLFHEIKWPGYSRTFLDENAKDADSSKTAELVRITSLDQEEYLCHLPTSSSKNQESEKPKPYYGPPPEGLLQPLFRQSSCNYRLEGYWTYEVCHGRHVRQFHEEKIPNKKLKVKEYFLGSEVMEKDKKDGDSSGERPRLGKLTIDSQTFTYYEQLLGGGTLCDLSGAPRRTYVRYVCHMGSRGDVYEIQETSSCEYTVVVLTELLCSHPDFQRKAQTINKLDCYPTNEKTPTQPLRYQKMMSPLVKPREEQERDTIEIIVGPDGRMEARANVRAKVSAKEPSKAPSKPAFSKDLHKSADEQLIREILSGQYCLFGGSGWWRHEFCLGKWALQFHEEPDGRTDIYLGYWNKEKHLAWLEKYPIKRPKPVEMRTEIRQYYTGGSMCDEIGQERNVEVKLRCIQNPSSPHSVAIFLTEPSTCKYILVVESQLLCQIVQQADDVGLLPTQR